MTENFAQRHGGGTGGLALLGRYEPDRERDALVRERCHAVIERRRRREPAPGRPSWRRALEPAVVGTLCAVYLFEVLSRAMQLYRF